MLRELVRAAEFNIAELFDDRNRLLPPNKWPREAYCVVASIEKKPSRGPLRQEQFKLQLTDRIKILERIGEIVGAFEKPRRMRRSHKGR